jgi:hypothetical protein
MFCQQEKECDRQESEQSPSGAPGHASAVLKVVWLMHDNVPVGTGLEVMSSLIAR